MSVLQQLYPHPFGRHHLQYNSRAWFHSSLPTPTLESTLSSSSSSYEAPTVTSAKNTTRRLLQDLPVGSMTEGDWNEAYPTFLWWTQQGTPESVQVAWKLLDRLVLEEQRQGYSSQPRLETHWLNRIVEMSRLVTVVDSSNDGKAIPKLAVGPQEWLDRMDRYRPYLNPNVATYTMTMNALTKWSREQTVELVELLLNRLLEEVEQGDDENLTLDVGVFNAVLYAWANAAATSGIPDAAQRAEAIFERIQQCGLEPDLISYSTLITVHARSSVHDANAAPRAEQVLRNLCMTTDQHPRDNNVVVEPNTIVYNSVLKAWECSSRRDSPHRADLLFREMMAMYHQDANDDVKPDAITFKCILRKLTYSGHIARADAIARQMQQMYEDGELDVGPTKRQLDAILQRWPTPIVKTPNTGQHAEALLRFMNALHHGGGSGGGDPKMRPSVDNFASVIAAWTRTANPNAAAHAEAVMDWMLEFDDDKLVPDTRMCTSIINAWSKKRDQSAPERAEALFERMKKWYTEGNQAVKPNLITYNALMKVWAKSRHPDATERVEAILRQMGDDGVHPDRVSYNLLINAYANSQALNAPERAESILRHLYAQHQAGDDTMKPDVVGFTTVIKAWANSKANGAGQRAEAFLRYMQEVYQETGDDEMRPNAVCYAMAIRAWINSSAPEAAERAGALLEEVRSLHRAGEPDMKVKKQTYFDVMTALASYNKKSNSFDSGKVAERFLLGMQELAEAGDSHMQPSTKFFNLAIRAWSNSGQHKLAAKRAESILNLLRELYNEHGRSDLKPNRLTFNFVIKAWSKSGDVFAGKRCEQLLHRMKDLAAASNGSDKELLEPDYYTYGDLSRAWSRSGHADAKAKAKMYATMSQELIQERQAHGLPSSTTMTAKQDNSYKPR